MQDIDNFINDHLSVPVSLPSKLNTHSAFEDDALIARAVNVSSQARTDTRSSAESDSKDNDDCNKNNKRVTSGEGKSKPENGSEDESEDGANVNCMVHVPSGLNNCYRAFQLCWSYWQSLCPCRYT